MSRTLFSAERLPRDKSPVASSLCHFWCESWSGSGPQAKSCKIQGSDNNTPVYSGDLLLFHCKKLEFQGNEYNENKGIE